MSSNNYGKLHDTWVNFVLVGEVFTQFFRNSCKCLRCIGPAVYANDKNINGKLAIVTGANTGIGKLQMAKREAKVSLKVSIYLLYILKHLFIDSI